eukprot:GAHX01001329.1.p2 GENE.GAHX01001329.1~~GAHX01001329.1.p2  ORF type:complete len:272 (+),score=56.85 GAHX01001329.1:1176-1991(+)
MTKSQNSTLPEDDILSNSSIEYFGKSKRNIGDLEYLLATEKAKTQMLSTFLKSKFFESFPKKEKKQNKSFNLLQLISRRFSGSIKSQLYDELRTISTTEELFDKYSSLLLDYNETYQYNNFIKAKLADMNKSSVNYKMLTRNRESLYNILHFNDSLKINRNSHNVPKLIENGFKWKTLALKNNERIQMLNKEKQENLLEITKLRNQVKNMTAASNSNQNLERRIIGHLKKVNARVNNRYREVSISLNMVLYEQIQNLIQKIKNIPKEVKRK